MIKSLKCVENGSNKFWTISVSGKEFTVTFGKVGTAGQCQVKSFDDEATALSEANKLVAQKLKKGYKEEGDCGENAVDAQQPSKTADKQAVKIESDIDDESLFSLDVDLSNISILKHEKYNLDNASSWHFKFDLEGLHEFIDENVCDTEKNSFYIGDKEYHFDKKSTLPAILENALKQNCECEKLYQFKLQFGDSVFRRSYVIKKEKTCGQFTYFDSDVICIVSTTSKDKDLVIPRTLRNKPVQILGNSCFTFGKFTSVTIPQTVKRIEKNAFAMSELKSVQIPDSVEFIGKQAFKRNESLVSANIPKFMRRIEDETFKDCKALNKLKMNDCLEYVGKSAFSSCALSEIQLPKTLKIIDERAFIRNCLKNVTIDDNVESIGAYAFYGNSELKEVSIGKNLATLGAFALIGKNLSNIVVSKDNVNFMSCDGSLYDKSGETLIRFSACEEAVIPDNVKKVECTAFCEMTSLNKIILGKNVEVLDDGAFNIPLTMFSKKNSIDCIQIPRENKNYEIVDGCLYEISTKTLIKCLDYKCNCTNIKEGTLKIGATAFFNIESLKQVIIPDSVEEIGHSAFYDCSKMHTLKLGKNLRKIEVLGFYYAPAVTELILPEGLKYIGENAFRYIGASDITLPDNTEYVGDFAFSQAARVEKVTVGKGSPSLGVEAFSYNNNLRQVCIKEGNKHFRPKTFCNCSALTNVVFEDGTVEISDSCFYDCNALGKITLPNTLKVISDSAFYGCAIKEFVCPRSLSVIGASVFKNCNSMKITLNEGLKTISSEAFDSMKMQKLHIPSSVECIYDLSVKGLNEITLAEGNTHFQMLDGCLIDIESKRLLRCADNRSKVILPSGIEKIEAYAFYQVENITEIVVPDGVTSIGQYAFAYSSVSKISLPKTLKRIGNSFCAWTHISEIDIPDSVEEIVENAFWDCSELKRLRMGNGVKVIKSNAFNGASELADVTFGNNIETIETNAFKGCSKIKAIVLPSTIKTVGAFAFSNCFNASRLFLGTSIQEIGEEAFASVRKFTDLTIPSSVKSIGNSAFKGCKSLTTLIIEEGVEQIGNSAFNNCPKLENIEIPSSVALIGNSAFKLCISAKTLVIGEGNAIIETSAFSQLCALESVKIGGALSLGANCFELCSSLIEFNVAKNITSIGKKCFDSCNALNKVLLPDSLVTISDNAFSKCLGIAVLDIPKSVSKIGGGVFNGWLSTQTINISAETQNSKGSNNLWRSGCLAKINTI